MRRCSVIGAHTSLSYSPRIHAEFAHTAGIELDYGYIETPDEDGFAAAVREFFAHEDAAGMNVTVPYKSAAAALADVLHISVGRGAAVNTLARLEDGRLAGHNTDGAGLIQDLKHLGCPLTGARALILGAGGAVRGVLDALIAAGVGSICIANRTPGRAAELAEIWDVETCALGDVPPGAELIINATAAGQSAEAPQIDPEILSGAFCYDLSYGIIARPFALLASAAGASGWADGIGMLHRQAALSFEIWHGVRPDAEAVRQTLFGRGRFIAGAGCRECGSVDSICEAYSDSGVYRCVACDRLV
ncbi:MAG: shikimate dehydrogenase [Gammaproteobacteria bacterium AqS3]|nr:shikimate dehydrogenase [Gammaproteobacteria bacterium AqS3]